MTEIIGEASIIIHAPVQQVYDYLLDFTRHPEWVLNLQKVSKLTDGPIRVGTVFRATEGPPPLSPGKKAKMAFFYMVGLLMGAKPYSEAQITALESDRRIAWIGRLPRQHSDFNRANWDVLLEPVNGGTHLTQRFVYQPQTWAARQMIGQAEGISQGCAVSLAKLKTVLEASPQA